MLLQTNSYIVPKERRAEHARLMRRFRQILNRIGCDNFEVYEQVGANWGNAQTSGRFVQIMRFRDRKHQLAVQNAERTDQAAQDLIAEFCELINYPYQVQQNLFAVGFYNSVLPVAPLRIAPAEEEAAEEVPAEEAQAAAPEPVAEAPQAVEEVAAEPVVETQAEEPVASQDVPEESGEAEPLGPVDQTPVEGELQLEEPHPTLQLDAPEATEEDADPLTRLADEFRDEPDPFHHGKRRASGNGSH